MQTGLYRRMCHAWCLAWQYQSHWAWQPVGGLHPLLTQHLLKSSGQRSQLRPWVSCRADVESGTQIIAFADLHKVRGVTDLRRAIIQAEKDRSLPSLVHQARYCP